METTLNEQLEFLSEEMFGKLSEFRLSEQSEFTKVTWLVKYLELRNSCTVV